jgi:hypothetical protein
MDEENRRNIYRGYRVMSLGTFPMIEIKALKSGDIPTVLKGLFTSRTDAQKAIDQYLNKLVKKGKRDEQKGSTATG